MTPVADDLVGVAVLSTQRNPLSDSLAQFPGLRERLDGAPVVTSVRGAGPLRQRTTHRVAGRVLLAGDASGYVDALTGEGISLGLAHARAAVAAIVADDPTSYERSWRAATRRYSLLTHALVQATRPTWARRLLVPAAAHPAERLPRRRQRAREAGTMTATGPEELVVLVSADGHAIGTAPEGDGPPCRHPAPPRLLRLPLRRPRLAARDAARPLQGHLPGRLDQLGVRAPGARGARRGRGAPPGPGRAGSRRARPASRAAALLLPGRDGRHRRVGAVPRAHRARRRGRRRSPATTRRGRGRPMGGRGRRSPRTSSPVAARCRRGAASRWPSWTASGPSPSVWPTADPADLPPAMTSRSTKGTAVARPRAG